jgi:hypothetical protein
LLSLLALGEFAIDSVAFSCCDAMTGHTGLEV